MGRVKDPTSLREFLRSRRARLTPADVGLPAVGPRRVAGLRREEVAALVGVSVDYYIRFEQARVTPSDQVLAAVGRALRLDRAEREHLRRLVHGAGAQAPPAALRPAVRHLVDCLEHLPAIVVNPRLDVLGWNRLAAALITDFRALPAEHRNTAWLLFVDPAIRRLYRRWAGVARDTAAMLRLAGADAAGLVDNLRRTSSEFRAIWAEHGVAAKSSGVKEFRHPVVGDLTLQYEALDVSDPGQRLVVYAPVDATAGEALRLLAAWSTGASQTRPAGFPIAQVVEVHRHMS
jgi:transcriptional regulator with XRE-family HTH domain